MLQALGFDRWQVSDVVHIAPDIVSFKHRHNFVVGFAAINHLNATHHSGF